MIINIVLGSGVLALGDSVGGHALVGGVFGSAKLLCKGTGKLPTRILIQEENSDWRFGKTYGHLPVDKLELVQPICVLGPELGQIRFGLLPLRFILVALRLQLLILEGALFKGSLGRLELLFRLGLGLDGGVKVLLLHVEELVFHVKLLLEPFYLGRMPLLPLHRLGLSGHEFILQLQMLKEEQLKKLAASVMRGLQKQSGQSQKQTRGLASEMNKLQL